MVFVFVTENKNIAYKPKFHVSKTVIYPRKWLYSGLVVNIFNFCFSALISLTDSPWHEHQEHDNVSYNVTGNNTPCYINCRFQWPRCLRFRSAAAWLLGTQIRIPLRAWMFVLYLYVVLFCVGRGLCDGLITRPEMSYCLSNCVWLRNLKRGDQGPMWSVAP
jgi:hypothetical protein